MTPAADDTMEMTEKVIPSNLGTRTRLEGPMFSTIMRCSVCCNVRSVFQCVFQCNLGTRNLLLQIGGTNVLNYYAL